MLNIEQIYNNFIIDIYHIINITYYGMIIYVLYRYTSYIL